MRVFGDYAAEKPEEACEMLWSTSDSSGSEQHPQPKAPALLPVQILVPLSALQLPAHSLSMGFGRQPRHKGAVNESLHRGCGWCSGSPWLNGVLLRTLTARIVDSARQAVLGRSSPMLGPEAAPCAGLSACAGTIGSGDGCCPQGIEFSGHPLGRV